MQLEGVYSVLPTPFHPDGEVDEASLRRVVDLFIAAGVSGVTALGVTGEVARLDEGERRRVLDIVVEQVNRRIGVVAGTTAEGTRTCIGYSRQAHGSGATAVMASPPRMAKLNSDGVLRHFAALASAVDIEIVVQDYPPACGFAMEPALLARIAGEIPRHARSSSKIRRRRSRPPGSSNRAVMSRFGFSAAWVACFSWKSCSQAPPAHDRVCVPGDPRVGPLDVSCRSSHRSGRHVLPGGAAAALRVPGRHRHGDPEGSPSPPRGARARGDAASRWRAATRRRARLSTGSCSGASRCSMAIAAHGRPKPSATAGTVS